MADVLFPEVEVELSGQDGNAAVIIGRVAKALRRAGQHEAASRYVDEAMSGDYDNVLRTSMKYVSVY